MSDPNSSKLSRSSRMPKDLKASIRGQLKYHAKTHGEDMLYVLSRYALERLLYRIGCSPHAEQFVVKGALLFLLWQEHPHRPTRDLDLLGFGSGDVNRIQQIFTDLCTLSIEDQDGLVFQRETIHVTPIRETQAYGGLRVTLQCLLGQTRIRVQVDIGFGDVITPAASFADFPSLIGLPPHVRVYPRETVVAEKYEAIVRLGAVNSRVKDFYDLWVVAHEYTFVGATLAEAIRATFKRRNTVLPEATPIALTGSFTDDPAKRQLWQAFIGRNKLESAALSLTETMTLLHEFLLPPTRSLVAGRPFDQHWTPGGPWQTYSAEKEPH